MNWTWKLACGCITQVVKDGIAQCRIWETIKGNNAMCPDHGPQLQVQYPQGETHSASTADSRTEEHLGEK